MTIERAKEDIEKHGAVVALAAQIGINDHLRWQLAEMEYNYRRSEYNYASAMLSAATKQRDALRKREQK